MTRDDEYINAEIHLKNLTYVRISRSSQIHRLLTCAVVNTLLVCKKLARESDQIYQESELELVDDFVAPPRGHTHVRHSGKP